MLFFNQKVLVQFLSLFLHKSICCEYSLEAPWRRASDEYHDIYFSRKIRKKLPDTSLIWSYEYNSEKYITYLAMMTWEWPVSSWFLTARWTISWRNWLMWELSLRARGDDICWFPFKHISTGPIQVYINQKWILVLSYNDDYDNLVFYVPFNIISVVLRWRMLIVKSCCHHENIPI